MQLADRLPQREPALRIEACGRFVEEQDVGTVRDRPRHLQPLRHAPGERVRRRLGTVGELELLEQLERPHLRSAGAPSEVAAVVHEVLDHGARPIESVELRDDTDAAAHAGGSATTSMPAMRTRPAVGMTRVVHMPTVVVLPAPFGPSNPKISPSLTARSMPSTALTAGGPA